MKENKLNLHGVKQMKIKDVQHIIVKIKHQDMLITIHLQLEVPIVVHIHGLVMIITQDMDVVVILDIVVVVKLDTGQILKEKNIVKAIAQAIDIQYQAVIVLVQDILQHIHQHLNVLMVTQIVDLFLGKLLV